MKKKHFEVVKRQKNTSFSKRQHSEGSFNYIMYSFSIWIMLSKIMFVQGSLSGTSDSVSLACDVIDVN